MSYAQLWNKHFLESGTEQASYVSGRYMIPLTLHQRFNAVSLMGISHKFLIIFCQWSNPILQP